MSSGDRLARGKSAIKIRSICDGCLIADCIGHSDHAWNMDSKYLRLHLRITRIQYDEFDILAGRLDDVSQTGRAHADNVTAVIEKAQAPCPSAMPTEVKNSGGVFA
jgi:hypothetical protein